MSNAALRLLKLQRSMGTDLPKELADIVSFDVDLPRGGSSATWSGAARFPGGDREVFADAGAASIHLYHIEIPEVDFASGGAHGEEWVVAGRGEDAEVHVEGDCIVRLELEEPFEGAAEGGARVAVLMGGRRELGRRRWVLRAEVLDRPEDDDVLICGARDDVVAMERDTATAGMSEGCMWGGLSNPGDGMGMCGMRKYLPVNIVCVDHGGREVRIHDTLGFVGSGHFACILRYYPLWQG